MICPACRSVMIVVEYEKIELDYCTNCLGVWFDAGELELLLDRMSLANSDLNLRNILSLPEAPSAEKKRKCPVCGHNMNKVNIGEAPKVLIDACSRAEGLWFDGGEVQAVVEQCGRQACPDPHPHGQVLSFLGDTLKSAKKPET